jgi:hypothetical protein
MGSATLRTTYPRRLSPLSPLCSSPPRALSALSFGGMEYGPEKLPSCAGSVCNQTAQIRHGDEQNCGVPNSRSRELQSTCWHKRQTEETPGLPGGGRRLVEPVTSFSENQSGSKIAVRLVAGPGQLGMYWAHVTVPDWCSQGVFALRKLVICPRNPGFVT